MFMARKVKLFSGSYQTGAVLTAPAGSVSLGILLRYGAEASRTLAPENEAIALPLVAPNRVARCCSGRRWLRDSSFSGASVRRGFGAIAKAIIAHDTDSGWSGNTAPVW